jgi:glutamate-1-semialdehyde 2,1-aminomutase
MAVAVCQQIRAELDRALLTAEQRYRVRHPQSAQRHAAAAEHLPGGSTRSAVFYPPFPLTWRSGRGNRLTRIDGHEYLDLLGEYSAGLYGHSNEALQSAIRQAAADGMRDVRRFV